MADPAKPLCISNVVMRVTVDPPPPQEVFRLVGRPFRRVDKGRPAWAAKAKLGTPTGLIHLTISKDSGITIMGNSSTMASMANPALIARLFSDLTGVPYTVTSAKVTNVHGSHRLPYALDMQRLRDGLGQRFVHYDGSRISGVRYDQVVEVNNPDGSRRVVNVVYRIYHTGGFVAMGSSSEEDLQYAASLLIPQLARFRDDDPAPRPPPPEAAPGPAIDLAADVQRQWLCPDVTRVYPHPSLTMLTALTGAMDNPAGLAGRPMPVDQRVLARMIREAHGSANEREVPPTLG